jgi:FkbM family methyltransferase
MSTAPRNPAQAGMDERMAFGAFAPSGVTEWVVDRTRLLPDTWTGRRTAFLLRRIASPFMAGAPVDVERLGARMRLHPYNNVCERRILFTPQYFDAEELAFLRERITPDMVFVDGGANVGAYALFVAAHAGPGARIVAVEPQPDIFDRLIFNIQQNPFGTIKAVACALADKTGDLTLFLDPRNSGESSIKIVGFNQAPTLRVPGTTLLDLLVREGFERVDAVKLDVEGAEDLVLEPFLAGAPAALLPRILVIANTPGRWQGDLPRLIEAKGYRRARETKSNLIFERG